MRKYINKGIYKNSMIDMMYSALAVLAIAITIVAAQKGTFINDQLAYYMSSSNSFIPNMTALFVITLVGAPLMPAVTMRFAWIRSQTDFEYAQPVTKGQLYFSKLLAVVTWQAIVMVFVTVLSLILVYPYIGTFVFVGEALTMLFAYFVCSLLIISAGFMAIGVSGKALATSIISLGIFGIPVLLSFSSAILSMNDFDIVPLYSYGTLHIPSIYSITNMLYSSFLSAPEILTDIPSLLFTLALSIVYIWLGYRLFRKRNGALAGTYTPTKWMHYITMSIMPLFFAYVTLGLAIKGYEYYTAEQIRTFFTYIAISFFLFMFYEIVIERRLVLRLRNIIGFILVMALSFAVNKGIISINENALQAQLNADEVESISFVQTKSYLDRAESDTSFSYGEMLAEDVEIVDRAIIEKIVRSSNQDKYEALYNFYYLVEFKMTSGKTIYKNVRIGAETTDENNLDYIKSILGRSVDYVTSYFVPAPADEVNYIYMETNNVDTYSQAELLEMYKLFMHEYSQLSYDKRNEIRLDTYQFETKMIRENNADHMDEHTWGTIRVKARAGRQNTLDNYAISDNTPQTANMFIELVNEKNIGEFERLYQDTNFLRSIEITSYSVDFALDSGTGRILLLGFIPKDNQQLIAYNNILEIIKNNDLSTPTIYDNVIKITWKVGRGGGISTMFLKVSSDEMAEIVKLTER
ncbi:MAG: hypothetical protein AB1Z23_03130 [Eubacteriales bacterium]